MKIGMVHHTFHPNADEVDNIMIRETGLFSQRGDSVRVVCGEGSSDPERTGLVRIPELSKKHADTKQAQDACQEPWPGEAFGNLRDLLQSRLLESLKGCDVVFVHDMLTVHTHLAATAALARLPRMMRSTRFIAYCHHFSAKNPDFQLKRRLGNPPWAMLAQPIPGYSYIVTSLENQRDFCKVMNVGPENCRLVPNGSECLRAETQSQKVG